RHQRKKFHEPHGINYIGEARGRVRRGRRAAETFAHLAQTEEQASSEIGMRRHNQHCGSFKEKKPSAMSQQRLAASAGVAWKLRDSPSRTATCSPIWVTASVNSRMRPSTFGEAASARRSRK